MPIFFFLTFFFVPRNVFSVVLVKSLSILSLARHAISGSRIESLAQSIDRPSMELAQVTQLPFDS